MSLPSLESINYTIGLLTLAGIAFAVWRSKSRQRGAAVADAILGREQVTDHAGNVIRPAEPGLVHRVATVEEAVVGFRHNIALYTELAKRVDNHDTEIKALKDATTERIVTKAEAAQFYRFLADQADLPPAEPIDPPEGEQ